MSTIGSRFACVPSLHMRTAWLSPYSLMQSATKRLTHVVCVNHVCPSEVTRLTGPRTH